MRVKLDENLPAPLSKALAGLGHDVDTVTDEGLGGCPDDAVWRETQIVWKLRSKRDVRIAHSEVIILRHNDISEGIEFVHRHT